MYADYNQIPFVLSYYLNNLLEQNLVSDEKKALEIARAIKKELNLEAHIVWTVEDVYEVFRERFNLSAEIELPQALLFSENDAKRVLRYVHDNHNRNEGITWNTIYTTILQLRNTGVLRFMIPLPEKYLACPENELVQI